MNNTKNHRSFALSSDARGVRRCSAITLGLLSLLAACNQKTAPANPAQSTVTASPSIETFPNLAAQANELNDALARKDHGRVIDFTYPEVIEKAGGRERMISTVERESNQMEAEGVVLLSSRVESPIQVLRESGKIYAVLPTVMKVKAKAGTFQIEGCLIGISSDNGANWKFIDSGGKDPKELRIFLAGVVDKLNLPAEKEPVRID